MQSWLTPNNALDPGNPVKFQLGARPIMCTPTQGSAADFTLTGKNKFSALQFEYSDDRTYWAVAYTNGNQVAVAAQLPPDAVAWIQQLTNGFVWGVSAYNCIMTGQGNGGVVFPSGRTFQSGGPGNSTLQGIATRDFVRNVWRNC